MGYAQLKAIFFTGTLLKFSGWLLSAATLYVSPTGNDETAVAGDPTFPFLTLTAACSRLQNGDRLEVAAGKYEVTPGYPNRWYSLPDYAPMQLSELTNVTIAGIGEVEIYGEGPGDFLMIQQCKDVRVENLTFRGNRPEVEDGGANLYSTVLLRGSNESLHFVDCRFLGFGNHAISHLFGPKGSYGMVVENCYFADGGDGQIEGVGEDGAAISGISSGSRIINNYIERCFRGIEVEGAHGMPITNVIISGNTITNCYTLGVMLFGTYGQREMYSDIKITNNRIVAMESNPAVTPYPKYGFSIWLAGGQNLEISDNYIDGYPRSGGGISVLSSFLPVKNVVISNNVVRNVRLRGIQAFEQAGNPLENVIITDNRVFNVGEQGVLMNGTQITAERNVITDSGWAGVYAGIELQSVSLGSSAGKILDNVVSNSAHSHSDYGIRISGATGTRVCGNTFSGIYNPAILDTGEDTEFLPKIIGFQEKPSEFVVDVSGVPGSTVSMLRAFRLGEWEPWGEPRVFTNDGLAQFVIPGGTSSPRRARFFTCTVVDP